MLAVSWPEFQPRLTPTPAYDERAFGDLAMLIRKAGEHGLRVALRVGFIWSFRPDAELPNAMRVDAAFHDAAIHAAWLDFVGEVCRRVCDSPHVVMGFLSWEDLFPFNLLGDAPNRDHLGFRREFVGWLRAHHPLADVGAKYGRSFASWADVPLPERRSPAYEYVLAWWDDALVERFFLPARQRFPRLSFEARVDWDPVWQGERIDWYRHDVQLRRAGAEVATVYYAVAWGMKNDGDSTDAPSALAQLDRLLASAAGESRARSLFIDRATARDAAAGAGRAPCRNPGLAPDSAAPRAAARPPHVASRGATDPASSSSITSSNPAFGSWTARRALRRKRCARSIANSPVAPVRDPRRAGVTAVGASGPSARSGLSDGRPASRSSERRPAVPPARTASCRERG